MKILIPAVLAAASMQPLSACDICSIYAATEAQGGAGTGLYGGIAEQFTHLGTLYDAGHEVLNTADQFIESSVSQIFIGYNVNNRLAVQFNLPVIFRAFQRPRGSTIENGSEFGVGDASLIGNFLAYERTRRNYTFYWNVIGGVKFPTGNSSHLSESDVESENGLPPSAIAGHDLALGSGSFDGIVGTGLFARWKHLFATGNFQYALRTEGSFGHEYADDLSWAAGPGFYLALTEDYTLAVQAVISGETKGKDTVNGIPDDDSAETIVYAGPQINFTWANRLSAQLGADLPLHIENSGLQVVPDYRIRAAFTLRF